jgi:EpsI family protein
MLLTELAADKIIYRRYSSKNIGPPITLFVAYYNTLEKAGSSHSPIVCFTGQGWHIDKVDDVEIPLSPRGTSSIRINWMAQSKQSATMVTLYWYQARGRIFTNRGLQKLCLFYRSLFRNSTSNAFVRLTVSLDPQQSYKDIAPYLLSFVQNLYPELDKLFL